MWGHCVGRLARRVAISPDATSGVNSALSEPLITMTDHKAVTGGTKCPGPERCDLDVSVSKLIHVCGQVGLPCGHRALNSGEH